MKILAINCHPDLTFLASKGINFDIHWLTIPNLKFPLRYLYKVEDSNGQMVDMSTPDVTAYLEANYPTFQHSIIFVGWNPADYGPAVQHTGGWTSPVPLSCGSQYCTVRQDNPVNPMYAPHEAMHGVVRILWHMGIMVSDFMDMTPVHGQWLPYFENDPNITDPLSNFNQTWAQISPYISKLNGIITMPTIQQSTINLIAKFEGLSLKPYQDVGGVWTIGYGATYDLNGKPITANTPVITVAQAQQILATQLKTYANAVASTIKVSLNQNQFDACCSLCYNIGTSGFEQSTVARMCNLNNFPAAAQAFILWDKVKGAVNQGLLARRKIEMALFLK